MARCPFPMCEEMVPNEPYALFCPHHHCLLPTDTTRFLFRWQIKLARCRDADEKQHMREQLPGYIQRAVRQLQSMEATLHG